MSFDLHLKLTGLCALVPRESLTTTPAAPAPQVPVPRPLPLTITALRVVLPDVRVEQEVGGKRICPHSPVLRVEQPDGTFQQVDVTGDDIEILTVDTTQAGVDLRPTFGLVADLGRVKPTFQVDDALFDQPIGRADVAARLRVTAATAFGVDPSPRTLVFPSMPAYTENFAGGVRLEMRVVDGPGEFRLTSLADGTVRTVPFGVKADGTPVQAELSNLCDELELVEAGAPVVDADFAAFYLLEPEPLRGPLFDVPEPLARARELLAEATRGVTCIPATTTAHGDT